MKKRVVATFCFTLLLGLMLAGCTAFEVSSASNQEASADPPSSSNETLPSVSEASDTDGEESGGSFTESATELVVRFGDEGAPFTMYLEDNETSAAIARYIGTSDWRLPIYHYDESEEMQYYDIPSRYDIPSDPEAVTTASAGDVYYSDPNRIVLYYHDAEIAEEYTKVGTFDATEDFISAVEDNPVLEGWDNKIVIITDGN